MKSPLLFLFAGFLALSSMASAQRLKIATVDMERLFNEYHQTSAIQKEINIERARIQKDNNLRLSDIREIESTIADLRKQLEAPDIGAKTSQDLRLEAKELQQDGIHKERERSEFLDRRNRSLNDKMRKQMRGILEEIQRVVSVRAKEGNYDYIFDKSGKSNQGIAFVLHAREMTDLTDSLLKEINEEK
ncbi:OmpH family outer membrane protein [Akkermansiaceae bacterium]|nr:OmpH family outer membrane protein [Akkermansiaceae bacterium]MDA7611683.1 OmpH family outer membrane protein [bacterium]MDA7538397.1 OmpH family outer membrane protein [Akkermansiaceae bacterium]MDA7651290.1 OmpH family outer membrane protein [Akkermansiaceae bacterium]MDA7672722.1 OmpH family outer membrane protein [Akkermansiaceae bacterium]